MKHFKTKLHTVLMTGLICANGLAWSAQDNTSTEVDIDVTERTGEIVITKGSGNDKKTTTESFTIDDGDDVDALIAKILRDNGVEHRQKIQVHTTDTDGDNEVMWVQKNNNVDVNLNNGQATIIVKKDRNGEVETISQTINVDGDTDVNSLVDQIMSEHGIQADVADVHRKVIKLDKHLTQINNHKPRMGFMANVQDNGWEVISVVPDSGSAEAGMLKGDVVISIDGQSTAKGGLGLKEFTDYDKNPGDISEVMVLRGGSEHTLNIAAKVIDSPDIIMSLNGVQSKLNSSVNDMNIKVKNLDGLMEGLQINVENLSDMVQGFGEREIHVVTASDADAYFFPGSQMNQWLGKNHHFSTITESLGKYFGTTNGVLVLEVDNKNKLGLKDGDVIQAINGQDVNSPKDVVKIMSDFKPNESFEIEIIREKETIYLES